MTDPISNNTQCETIDPALVGASRQSCDNSPQAWQTFVDHYERFTDLICAAARLGCSAQYEGEFADLRPRLVMFYAPVAHRVRGAQSRRSSRIDPDPKEPFEKLIHMPNLHDLLNDDSGDLIPNLAEFSERIYAVPI